MDQARLLSHLHRCATCLCVAVVLALIPMPRRLSAAPAVDPRATAAMQRFFERTTSAQQYSASRRLEASGKGHQGWLDVETEFNAARGLSYHVTAEGGSGYIRSRVLRSLLDAEQNLIARGDSASVALSFDNYQLTPNGIDAQGLALIDMRPLRKDRSLITGGMFLTMDGTLVRVEGRLAKNPSFWVSRVNLVRTYRRLNGVLMPVSLDTTAQLRLFGSSALHMTYRYARIDERDVVNEPDD